MKKSLSILLLVCMLLSMFAGTGFTLRSAAEEEIAETLVPAAEEEAPVEEEVPVEEPAEEAPVDEEAPVEEAPVEEPAEEPAAEELPEESPVEEPAEVGLEEETLAEETPAEKDATAEEPALIEEASEEPSEDGASAGWTEFGTCEWQISGDVLTIRPLNNGTSGTLPDDIKTASGWGWYAKRNYIKSVYIASGVVAGKSLAQMFSNYTNLESVDISNLDTKNVESMSWIFNGCEKLTANQRIAYVNTLLKGNGGKCTDWGSYLFAKCPDVTIDVKDLDTSKLTTMKDMFANCTNLTTIKNLSSLDTSSVESMQLIFMGCSNLGATTRMSYMNELLEPNNGKCTDWENGLFRSCTDEKIELTSACLKSYPYISANMSKVTDMSYMFMSCKALKSLDLSGLDTSSVTSMNCMFNSASMLASLDLSGFDTSNVTDMSNMFGNCTALVSLNLSGWDTSKVNSFLSMFTGCSKLTTILVSENLWNVSSNANGQYMFKSCTSLKGGSGTKFSAEHIDKEYARIDGGTSAPGYLTKAVATATVGGVTTTYASVQEAINTAYGTSAEGAGTVQLVANAKENVTVAEGKYVTLDLNGYVLQGTGSDSVIFNMGTLTIQDSNTGKQTHHFSDSTTTTGLWVWDSTEKASAHTVTGGVIIGGTGRVSFGNACGGGICVIGKLTLKGGSIIGNTAVYGGVFNQGTFNMSGGSITGNAATYGGGVYNCGNFTIEDGSITGNTAASGGGVFNTSTFTMSGGSITGNKATNSGGGVCNNQGTFTMSKGSITGNTATKQGGGIHSNGKLSMTGGSITDNKSTGTWAGGGLYYWPTDGNSYVKLSGAVTITGNTTNGEAANLCLSGETSCSVVDATGLTTGSSIGVTTMIDDKLAEATFATFDTSDAAETAMGYFFADDSVRFHLVLDGESLKLEDTAVDYTLVLSGGEVFKSTDNGKTKGEKLTATGIKGSGDAENGYTYTFKDVKFVTTAGIAIEIKDKTAAIELDGTNTVVGGDGTSSSCYMYGIYASYTDTDTDATLTIDGTGSLYVMSGTAQSYGGDGAGINILHNLVVNGGRVVANAGWQTVDDTSSRGIFVCGNMTVNGGEVIATSGTVSGSLCASSGLCVAKTTDGTGNLTVNGGTVTATGGAAALGFGLTVVGELSVAGTGKIVASCDTNANIPKAVFATEVAPDVIAKDDSGNTLTYSATDKTYKNGEAIATAVTLTPAHTHSFTYAVDKVDKNVITATCSTAGCGLTDSKVSVTLSADNKVYTSIAYVGANLDSTAWEAAGLSKPTIQYEGRDGTTYAISTTAPTNVGKYTAEITVGEVTATADFEITKQEGPAAPTNVVATAVTEDSVTLTANTDWEYSQDGTKWQNGNTFTGLTAAQSYTFYVRVRETDTVLAGKNATTTVYTAAKAPAAGVGYTVNYTSETITAGTEYEVSSSNSTLTPLTNDKFTPGTTYYVRVKATSTVPASAWVAITTAARAEAPAAVTTANIEKNDNSITVKNAVAGQQYSIDGGKTWIEPTDGKVVFADRKASTDYTITTRVKATASAVCSATSAGLTVKTKASAPDAPNVNPTDVTVTEDSVTLPKAPAGETWEYSIDGGKTWKSSNKFEDLEAGTPYTFQIRTAETDTAVAGVTKVIAVYTAAKTMDASEAASALEIDYNNEKTTFDDSKYEVTDKNGAPVASGAALTPGETYKIRTKAVSGGAPASEYTEVTIPARPATPATEKEEDISKTVNSITVANSSKEKEYSINGGETWIAGNGGDLSFTDLTPNTPYQLISRVKATKESFASLSSEALDVYSTAETPKVEGVKGFTAGSASDMTVVIGEGVDELTPDNLDSVAVDGKVLKESKYTVEGGCIKITLSKRYLNTLEAGKHELAITLKGQGYEGMVLTEEFTIAKAPETPKAPGTGDDSNVVLWFCLLAFCGAATVLVSKKRKEN